MKKSLIILLLLALVEYSYCNIAQINSNCTTPPMNGCDWYSSCLYPVTPNCNFILDTMEKKCEEFENILPSFSPLGQQWLNNVRVCIQDKLANTFLNTAGDISLNCDVVTNSFFGDHPGCYFNGTISFCQLPFKEQVEVAINGADMIFSKNIIDILEIANEIRKYCF